MVRRELSRSMTNSANWRVHPAKTLISLGICLVWSKSSLSAWRNHVSLVTYWAHSEDSDQAGGCTGLSKSFLGAQIILCFVMLRLKAFNLVIDYYTTAAEGLFYFIFIWVLQPDYLTNLESSKLLGGAKTWISKRKTTWKPASRTWLVLHVTRTRLKPTEVWFDFCFTSLKHILGHFGRGQLT